jgi:hypothetical protein
VEWLMRSLRRLAKDEFAACFAAPMLNSMATAEPVVDVWGYVEAIALPLGQATDIVIPNAGLEKLGVISKSGALRLGRSTLATPSTHTQPTPSGPSIPGDVCKLRLWILRATALGYPAVERISVTTACGCKKFAQSS